MAKFDDVIPDSGYSSTVRRSLLVNGGAPISVANPLPVDAVVSVDSMSVTAEMKVDSGHDLYLAENVARVDDLAVSFDLVTGLDLTHIQSVENKTQGWVYSTKGATVTTTGITLVAGNQKTGYPNIGVADEIEIVYRGESRLDIVNTNLGTIETDIKNKKIIPTTKFTSPDDFTATYTSNVTITLSALPFTISNSAQVRYITVIPATGSAKIYVNGSDGVTITESSNVLTISGAGTPFASGDVYEVGINAQDKAFDASTNTFLQSNVNPVWERYTDPETLVTAQDLTDSYADFGSEIDMRGYNRLGGYIIKDVNDSENVTLQVLGKHESDGTDEYEIDSIPEKTLWTTGASDGKVYFEFDIGTIPYIQLQAKATTVGATAGDLSIVIDKKWRN